MMKWLLSLLSSDRKSKFSMLACTSRRLVLDQVWRLQWRGNALLIMVHGAEHVAASAATCVTKVCKVSHQSKVLCDPVYLHYLNRLCQYDL